MEWTVEELKEVKEKIEEKARNDKDFRDLCLTNPEEAIEQIVDKKLPPELKIRFIKSEDAYLIDSIDTGELSDDELHQVAAGSATKPSLYCLIFYPFEWNL